MAGAETDSCIRSTIHGVFARGYDVTLVGDDHTTNDQSQWGVLSVTLNDDEASCCLTMSFGGVVGTVTWWSSAVMAGIVVVFTMTVVFGHAGVLGRGISGAQG